MSYILFKIGSPLQTCGPVWHSVCSAYKEGQHWVVAVNVHWFFSGLEELRANTGHGLLRMTCFLKDMKLITMSYIK